MHLVNLSEDCPFPFENPTHVLFKKQTYLCTTDVVKNLCFIDSEMEVKPYLASKITTFESLTTDTPFSLIIEGSLIDHLLIWQQLFSQKIEDRCTLYTHYLDAAFLNELLNTSSFRALPATVDFLTRPYLYTPPSSIDPQLIKDLREWLNAILPTKTRELPQKNQVRVALALQAYRDPQWLDKPLVREVMEHLKEYEKLIFWNHQDIDFIYPDHLAYSFDPSIKFTLQENLELLKKADFYVGPYNHWMCLALIFDLPILALSQDLRAIKLLSHHSKSTFLPKSSEFDFVENSCCLCGNITSKVACKRFCKKMKSLSIDQISDHLFFFLETSLWPIS